MSLDERVSSLIKQIYCAGSDPARWNAVASNVLALTGAHAGLTSVVDLRCRQFSSYRAYGPENTSFARGMDEYGEMYARDPSLIWGANNPNKRFIHSADTLPTDQYESNEYVKWNRSRFGSTHWCVGYTPGDDELSFSFSLHFPAVDGPGDAGRIRLFRMLFDHMECAVRLNHRPFAEESTRALVLLTAEGRVRQVSRGGEGLLRGAGALSLAEQRLLTASSGDQAKLDAAIGAVRDGLVSGAGPIAIELEHPLGSPWIVVLRPIPRDYGAFGTLVCDIELEIQDRTPKVGSLRMVQSLFDLTGRELQVVTLLAQGHSVESLSARMTISSNTARTHLRAIFGKTRTSRQSELLQLCSSLAEA